MGKTIYKSCAVVGIIALLFWGQTAVLAAGDTSAAAVTVSYSKGKTDLRAFAAGDHFFSNRVSAIGSIPDYLNGLQRTVRAAEAPADLSLDIAAGATVYALIDSDGGKYADAPGVADLHKNFVDLFWTRLDDVHIGAASSKIAVTVYRHTFAKAERLTISATGYAGVIIASANLELATTETPAHRGKSTSSENPDAPAATPRRNTRSQPDSGPLPGATVRIANPQATIKILTVLVRGGRDELGGQSADLILTVTPGNQPQMVNPHFVTPVGQQMLGVTDDVLRFLHVKYPNWYAQKAEFTFSDRGAYDGPSIGAAVGTVIRAVIEGFQIDPAAAITGDIAANGAVHGIGGLAFKLHGAAHAGCSIVAAPMENYDNLVDAVIYKGISTVSDIQVIGISNLDDAVATMRSDRDAKLAKAIEQFASVQETLKDRPTALSNSQIQANLQDIVSLAPKHLSARILLLASQKKLPRTLSATASMHYMDAAVAVMLPVLKDDSNLNNGRMMESSVVLTELADLNHLHAIAHVKVQPLIEAWSHFIRAWSDLETGHATKAYCQAQLQKLRDEAIKADADPDLNQDQIDVGM